MEYMNLIEGLQIPVHLNCKLEEVTDKSVICSNMNLSGRIEFPADAVLLALGMTSREDVAFAPGAVRRKRRSSLSVMRRKSEILPPLSSRLSRPPHIFKRK